MVLKEAKMPSAKGPMNIAYPKKNPNAPKTKPTVIIILSHID